MDKVEWVNGTMKKSTRVESVSGGRNCSDKIDGKDGVPESGKWNEMLELKVQQVDLER